MTKATEARVDLPPDAAFFIAQRIRSNVRELEGALKRVIASANFVGRPIDIELIKESLKDLAGAAGQTDQHGQYSAHRRRVLQDQGVRHDVAATQPIRGPATADGDGAVQGADQSQPAGDRRQLRWARPHDSVCTHAVKSRNFAKLTPIFAKITKTC